MHEIALGPLYSFAGKARTVHISKGGFLFPSPAFLEPALHEWNAMRVAKRRETHEEFILRIAAAHAEFLYLHPFREGNGRAARLSVKIEAAKFGLPAPDFAYLETNKDEYIRAVQAAAAKKYAPMQSLFRYVFQLR